MALELEENADIIIWNDIKQMLNEMKVTLEKIRIGLCGPENCFILTMSVEYSRFAECAEVFKLEN